MGRFRSDAGSEAVILAALFLAAATPRAGAQETADTPPPHKSVYGKVQAVDKSLNGVIMESDDGERLAWRFDARVIAEMGRFKPGTPMIVIYRQLVANEKRATAVAFPGTAATPTYLNTTGSRVVLRSGPAVDGVCGVAGAGPISETTIPVDGRAEVMDACWCCAPSGETCTTGNKSGLGQALLVQCFK